MDIEKTHNIDDSRAARYYDQSSGKNIESQDKRSRFERDRDRLLYSLRLRRLSGVTQVVGPREGKIFHDRLTHSLEVAQIALRLAQYLNQEYEDKAKEIGGIIPEAAEAGALAHDLGHPPFGHTAEQELNRLGLEKGKEVDLDGFEGNAQSFRIITKLAVYRQHAEGLNLTRATLNAVLKYPWLRCQQNIAKKWNKDSEEKWGVYRTEKERFEYVRADTDFPDGVEEKGRKTVEAEIMDWADDIAYSIHDMEDFYRAGLLPLPQLLKESTERERFKDYYFSEDVNEEEFSPEFFDDFLSDLDALSSDLKGPYKGTKKQQGILRHLTSTYIGSYVEETELQVPKDKEPFLKINEDVRKEVKILKEYDQSSEDHDYREERIRTVMDYICSMTDKQALKIFKRLTGQDPGSIMDVI